MSKIQVVDANGKAAGDIEIPEELLVAGKGGQAVHDAVVRYLARRRAGTASTKSKSEVAGTGAKPWRQKGTGRARAGYRQSPIWRGGGVAFGPRPRVYGGKINRKVAQLAFRRALSDRIAEGAVRVVEAIEPADGKTRTFVALLDALKARRPALIVVDRVTEVLARASRNVAGVEVVAAGSLNTYQVVRYPALVATRAAMDVLKSRLGAAGEAA